MQFIDLSIDTILYNPDTTIALVLFIKKRSVGNSEHYDGRAVFLYREKASSEIRVYPITKYSSGSYNESETREVLNFLYFKRLGKKKDNQGYPFLYSIGDKEFWTKSLFFKRVTNGYFYFQTRLDYSLLQNSKTEEYILLKYPVFK